MRPNGEVKAAPLRGNAQYLIRFHNLIKKFNSPEF